MLTISLPWPAREHWQNWRGHWTVKARAVKEDRQAAKVLTLEALGGGPFPLPHGIDTIQIMLTFYQPARTTRFDLPNAVAACKAYVDGIADALGVDDSRFALVAERGSKGGRGAVIVQVGV